MLNFVLEGKIGSNGIASRIREEILSGKISFKDRLPSERVFTEIYSVSRGTVRAALRLLEAEKLIEIRSGSGAFVSYDRSKNIISPIENANPLELIDARFALEPHVCRLITLYGTKQNFDALDKLAFEMEKSEDDPVEFASADTTFHTTLTESTGNKLLIWIISQITAVRGQAEWTKARNLTLNKETIKTYNNQHREIIDAIKSREPETAASLMKNHLETARLSLTRASGT